MTVSHTTAEGTSRPESKRIDTITITSINEAAAPATMRLDEVVLEPLPLGTIAATGNVAPNADPTGEDEDAGNQREHLQQAQTLNTFSREPRASATSPSRPGYRY